MIIIDGIELYTKEEFKKTAEYQRQKLEAGERIKKTQQEIRRETDRNKLLTAINIALAIFQLSMLLLLIVRIR